MNLPSGYTSERISLPVEFEELFSHFYLAANNGSSSVRKTLLPSYQTILLFSFGKPVSCIAADNTTISTDRCILLGPIRQAMNYELPIGSEILVANFKSDAAYRFFGNALVTTSPVDPDDLVEENCFTNLWQALHAMATTAERVGYILDFARPYIRDPNAVVQRINAITEAASANGLNPVKLVADEYGQSERAVQLAHKKFTGYSVKEISRYQRWLKSVSIIQQFIADGKDVDWFEIIHECQYYDQSQLIHDFKHYVNLSPAKFVKFQEQVCVARP